MKISNRNQRMRVRAADENSEDKEPESKADIEKRIKELDGKDGVTEERKALYDKLEKLKSKEESKVKTKITKHIASTRQTLVAALKAMAHLETADANSSVEEVLDIIESRLKSIGVAKAFKTSMFGYTGCTYLTKHVGGESFVFRMVLQANGFSPRVRTPSVISFTRNAKTEEGIDNQIEVTLVAGYPDVVIINAGR